MIRPRFHCAFESPTAATRCSRGTRRGSAFWNAGKPNAPTEPVHSDSTAMIAGVARPVPTTIARIAASSADSAFVDDEDPAAVQAVRHRRADRAEHGRRHEPGGPDDGGPRRLAGGVGDVVAERHRLHPRADVRHERPDPQDRVAAIAERRERGGRHRAGTLRTRPGAAKTRLGRMRRCRWDHPEPRARSSGQGPARRSGAARSARGRRRPGPGRAGDHPRAGRARPSDGWSRSGTRGWPCRRGPTTAAPRR